jgi:hypothetical protein
MLVCDYNHVKIFSDSTYKQYNWRLVPHAPHVNWYNCYGAVFDEKMDVWVADYNSSGLVHIPHATNRSEIISAEGPANSKAYELFFDEGNLAMVPGYRSNAISADWSYPAISILENDQWWTHTTFNQYPRANGFNSVVINPLNKNEIYLASWNGGLFKINKSSLDITVYNNENSPISTNHPLNAIFVSGLAIDKQNNLWMANTHSIEPIKVKELNTTEEKWHSLNLSPYATASPLFVEHILVDSRSYKWVTVPIENKLIVLRGALDNIEKKEVEMKAQANVAGDRLTCIAEDREGRIWTGHDQGVKVIYDAAQVFNKTVYARNILIEQIIDGTGYTQILLESEHITCIAVDAADRKWIGTRSAGVFFLSPNGTQELFHFTIDNSPLFSNHINDIKINPENGEVFIATEGGLLSFKGTATKGAKDYKEVLVYPNPVREDYHGPIAVKGLMEDSFCKITDAAGNLVWQGYAYGGQLIWNGRDFYGKRPATGVYFVMASSKTGKEKTVAKFLFVQ